MGMANGAIRVQKVIDGDLGETGPYWILNSHDNQNGNITHISISNDGKFIFTVGADGNFFSYEFMEETKIEEKVKEAKAKIPSARVSALSFFFFSRPLQNIGSI